MKTYSFSYINEYGCGDVIDVKDFSTDQEAMKHGRELLDLYVLDISDRELRRQDWQDPCIGIDKWADGYPAADTFGTEDEVEPIASACIVAEFSDDHKTINYKEQGF